MIRKLKSFAIAAVASLVVGAAAHAGTVNFAGPSMIPTTASQFDFVGSDGIAVTAVGTANDAPTNVAQSALGLGVKNGRFDLHQIDNLFKKDQLYLFFSTPVQIHSITFTMVGYNFLEGNNDEYSLSADGVQVSIGEIPGGNILDLGYGTVQFNNLPAASIFTLGGLEKNDGFKVYEVSYSEANAVPLPPAAWAGLATFGLGAVVQMRRKLTGIFA